MALKMTLQSLSPPITFMAVLYVPSSVVLFNPSIDYCSSFPGPPAAPPDQTHLSIDEIGAYTASLVNLICDTFI